MTPSRDVDEAWHLHLIYTRSYWDDLCGKVLRRPLHHNPTSGGAANARRFREAYEATLAAYEHEFRAKPPADIWPDADTRFAARRTDGRRPGGPLRGLAAAAVFAFLTLWGAIILSADALSAAAKKKSGGDPLAIVVFLLVVVIIIHVATRSKKKRDGGGGCGSGGGDAGGDSGCGGGGCGGGGCGG